MKSQCIAGLQSLFLCCHRTIKNLLFFILTLSFAETISGQTEPALNTGRAYIIQLTSNRDPILPSNYNDLSRYHFFGICWNGKVEDNLRFARQMGYSYVMYQRGMENHPLASGLHFYIESPEYEIYKELGVTRSVNPGLKYSDEQISAYQHYYALKDTLSPFPENLATGWFSSKSFSVEPDWQQQKVIDFFSGGVMALAHRIENPEKKFLFGGFVWDVPLLTGDFWGNGKQVSLAHWTGKDSSIPYPGTTHNYDTYSDGRASYFISINEGFKSEFPGRKLSFIIEPYQFYEQIQQFEKLDPSKLAKLFENMFITQESGKTKWNTGTEFADDARIFQSGLIDKTRVGSSTPDNHDLPTNRLIAAKAAVNGAWFNWMGRFSGSGDNVPMKNIYEVPNWLQLTRVVANWDNLNGIALSERKWDGTVYQSPNSRMDDKVIYSRQPGTRKLFVVFFGAKGEIELKPGEKVVSVHRVDPWFCETTDGTGDLLIRKNKIRINNNICK